MNYNNQRGRGLSGSGRRKPKQVQATPAEYHEGIYCGRLRLASEPAKEISYVPTRSEQIANANLSICQALKRQYWQI